MNAILEHINSAGQWFAGSAGAMLLQSSVLILILLLADFLLRKKVRAVFRYWLLMLVLVKLVLPVTLGTPFSLGNFVGEGLFTEVSVEQRKAGESGFELPEAFLVEGTRPAAAVPVTQEVQVGPAAQAVDAVQTAQAVAVAAVRWEGAVFVVWAVVVLVMMVMLLQRAIFVFGLVAQAGEASERMRDELEQCRERMGMRGKIGLKVSANATSPAVCGLFRPVILVPQELGARLTKAEMRAVLLHELSHIKRGDLWVNLVQTVLQIVYFYNPLLWAANAVIRRVREQAVDEAVLVAMGEGARAYPEVLVNVAKMAFGRPALSLRLIGVVESKSALKGRVKRMLEMPLPKTAKLGIAGLVIVLLFGSVLLPMAKVETGAPEFVIKGVVTDAETGEPIAGAKVGDDKEYNDGKFCTVTDSDGNYEYKTWYEEHFTRCEAAGYKTEKKILLTKLLGSEKEKVINFALTCEKGAVEVEGGKGGGEQVDLLLRYPTTLEEKDTNPANAREWDITEEDIFYAPSFRLNIGNELKVEIGKADIGIGNSKDGAVWAIVIPRSRGTLISSANEGDEIEHLWLRFHPAEINNIFEGSQITEGGDKSLLGQMKWIAKMKMRSSWQAGGKAMIPGRTDITVDADTKEGPRRFFMVDTGKMTAEYVSAFENQSVPKIDLAEIKKQTYKVTFRPKGDFTPTTAGELLKAFSSCVKYRVKTHHFRTEVKDDMLYGHILTDSSAEAKGIELMLERSESLEFVEAAAVNEEQLAEHYAMSQPGLKTGAEAESERGRGRLRAKFERRMARDRRIYSERELGEIERLYQVANKKWNSPEVQESLEKLVARYSKANRTGCAVLYLGRMSDGVQKERYLKRAIEDFGDCMYGDGVQVGAFARYTLAMYYNETGRKDEAKGLTAELINDYPDAVGHDGKLLIEQIPEDLKISGDSEPKRRGKNEKETDQNPVGKWRSVDFVEKMEEFEPGAKSWRGDLYLKDLEFMKGGRTSGPWNWKKGRLWHPGDRTKARYVIKEIDGVRYLFMEWISGDVTIRGQEPRYYVLKRVD